jgi:hypothetical protein
VHANIVEACIAGLYFFYSPVRPAQLPMGASIDGILALGV